MAAFAMLVVLAHLLFAQLTFMLAVVFTVVGKVSRWRLWWLAAPAAAGLAWMLATGPRAAGAASHHGRHLLALPTTVNTIASMNVS